MIAGVLLVASTAGGTDSVASQPLARGAVASAVLHDQAGAAVGEVSFEQVGEHVRVRATVQGLAPAADFHGFHIHANGACSGDFVASAGGHWNPSTVTHGDHAGDLPVLYADAGGVARSDASVDGFTVDQLLADDGGVAVIVHAGRDNYANVPDRYSTAAGAGPDTTTKNTGDAGGRYACGIVTLGTPPTAGGYRLVAADGGVFAHGDATFHGSSAATPLRAPVVGTVASPSGRGYYLAASDGGVFTHGDATFEGSIAGRSLNAPVVAIAAPAADAVAVLRDQSGAVSGHVTFQQDGGMVRVRAMVSGLAPASDFHGFHIHANGACSGDFVTSAGGHWNPGGVTHGDHMGDMPVLHADAKGVARSSFVTDAFTVAQLLGDEGGVAIVVHAARDNYGNIPDRYSTAAGVGADSTTKNTGDAGARLLCGAVAPPGGSARSGYWLAASDGGVFALGDAPFHGSAATLPLRGRIVDAVSSPSGGGYWLAGADGGVFAFGDAVFAGSAGAMPLNAPVVAIAPTPTGRGYVLVAADGGVFAFGDAVFAGSRGGEPLNAPIVDAAMTDTGGGYWLFAADGGVFAFGDAVFAGSDGGHTLNAPIVGASAG